MEVYEIGKALNITEWSSEGTCSNFLLFAAVLVTLLNKSWFFFKSNKCKDFAQKITQ